MRIKQLAKLHMDVVHGNMEHVGKCRGVTQEWPARDTQGRRNSKCLVCQEEKHVRRMAYDKLNGICLECFANVN